MAVSNSGRALRGVFEERHSRVVLPLPHLTDGSMKTGAWCIKIRSLPRPTLAWLMLIGRLRNSNGLWRMMRARWSCVHRRYLPADGPRNPGHKDFDPFWSRVNEAGITVVTHIGQTRHDSNGYDTKNIDALSMGSKPSVTNFHRSRNINDFLASLVFDRLFERFPNVRIASIENGSEFLSELLRFLAHTKDRLPNYFDQDPVESFREHVWLNPFWEDDIEEIIELMGPDRVILGSDWPHMEGLQKPRDILEEVERIPFAVQEKILFTNANELNQRRPL